MTAFDLFQKATCEISAGRRGDAAISLTKAIRKIDTTGDDAHLRADLVELRALLIVVPA